MGHGKRDDMVVHEQEPYNAEPPPAALAGRALTALDAFYSRNHGPIPSVDRQTWRLEVGGLVTHRLYLSVDQLRSRYEEQTLVATLQCAGNRRKDLLEFGDIPGEAPWGAAAISTAEWTGVRLSDVLSDAGLHPDAKHVEFLAPDIAEGATPPQPYGSSISVGKAVAGEVLLAWAMNAEPLPAAHGAPVRIVVPGHIGARSVKWVERITALAAPSTNYFQAVAYRLPRASGLHSGAGPDRGVALAEIALNSDILRPDDGAVLRAGPTAIAGYAIAGEGLDVARVEVSHDGGRTWHQARMGGHPSQWAWRHWQVTLDLPPGRSKICARAWDTSGATQPQLDEQLWNPKGYVNNSWPRIAVTVQR